MLTMYEKKNCVLVVAVPGAAEWNAERSLSSRCVWYRASSGPAGAPPSCRTASNVFRVYVRRHDEAPPNQRVIRRRGAGHSYAHRDRSRRSGGRQHRRPRVSTGRARYRALSPSDSDREAGESRDETRVLVAAGQYYSTTS